MSDIESSLLTRKEAANLLGIPEGLLVDTARRKRGGPPFYKFTTRTILYDREELLKWFATARVAPAGRVSRG
jgi:hypothetical protein